MQMKMSETPEMTPSAVNAEIIAIGTEILLGEITDTNSVYLARQLRDLGINLYFMTSVGDNEGRITQAIENALARAQVVVTCGGLGPTVDDMTRQGVAAAVGRPLVFHQDLLDAISLRFAGFRAVMTENNRRQAFVPQDALVIENPVGTAPAFIVEKGDRAIISLPGVPREMKFLFETRVAAYLREHYRLGGAIIKARVLKTAGVGESALDALIGDDLLTASNPTVGLAAHSGQVDVRITAKAASPEEADTMIATTEAMLRQRIGEHIFGADSDQLDDALVRAVATASARLKIVEAGVAPALSERADLLRQGGAQVDVERFADDVDLRARLGLATESSLRAVAEQAAQRLAADDPAAVAIAAVSRASDSGDEADDSERTALAVSFGGEARSRSYGFGGNADEVRRFLVTWAWAMAWRLLRDRGA
jgi:nicotinamide-nucleotide amidase